MYAIRSAWQQKTEEQRCLESCLDITEAENVPFHLLHSHSYIKIKSFFHFPLNMVSVIYSQPS